MIRPLLCALLLMLSPTPILAGDGLDDVAMDALRDALRDRGDLAQAWFRLRAGDADGALSEAKAALLATPRDPDALHLVGIAAATAGKRALAEQSLRRSLRLRANGWVARHLVALLIDAGRVGAAGRALADAQRKLPGDPRLARAAASVAIARGDLPSARARLEEAEAREASPSNAFALSIVLEEIGDDDAAVAALRRAVQRAPDEGTYRLAHFDLLSRGARWDELEAATSLAGADAAGAGRAPYYRGIALLRLGRAEAARAAFAGVLQHGKSDAAVLAGAAGYLLQLGADAEAERAARAALAQRDEDAVLHHLLAMSLTRLDREAEALAHYRRAVELQEGSAPYRFDLALSLCALRRVDELTATLEKARKEFPEDARWAELDARCPAEP